AVTEIRDEAARAVPLRIQRFGQRRVSAVQRCLVAGRELVGPSAREQAGMRWQRPRGGRERLLEHNPARAIAREVRRGLAAVAVEAETRRPNRIERDEQNVWPLCAFHLTGGHGG